MRFNELGLAEPIVRAVTAEGYTAPTPIQSQAIPEVLAGRDVLGCAQTGTGKTGAFALPILHRLAATADARVERRSRRGRNQRGGGRPRSLILCPTRELATQIYNSFRTYGKNLRLRHTVVFGGVSQNRQVRELRAGVDVLVATPGRLLDLIGQGFIDLRGIEILVLDEADHMMDMGFIHDIRKVVGMLPERRQTLLFSATMPAEIRRLADSILDDPISLQSAPVASPAEAVEQGLYLVERKNKPVLLERLLRREGTGRTLVFTRTKHGADKVVKILRRSGIKADAIHGNKTQNARTKALDGFKSGKTSILVATDIAARGIDVDDITHVINFDLPSVPETYVHRIGRTARAGASGIALAFCDREELGALRAIERLIGSKLSIISDESDLLYEASAIPRKQDRRQASGKPASGALRRKRGRSGPGRGGPGRAGRSGGSDSNGQSSSKNQAAKSKKRGKSSKKRVRVPISG